MKELKAMAGWAVFARLQPQGSEMPGRAQGLEPITVGRGVKVGRMPTTEGTKAIWEEGALTPLGKM